MNKSLYNKHFKYLLILFTFIGLISCKKNEEVKGDGYIRIVNTVRDSNPQDFYQIDSKISSSAISYGNYINYQPLKSGANTLYFKDAVSGEESAKPTGGIVVNGYYTAFYYQALDGTFNVKGLKDNNVAPAAGKAKVRFVNFNKTINNNLELKLADGNVLGKIPYFTESNYGEVNANAGITVTDVASQNSITISANDLVADKIYTIWFDSNADGNIVYHVIQQN